MFFHLKRASRKTSDKASRKERKQPEELNLQEGAARQRAREIFLQCSAASSPVETRILARGRAVFDPYAHFEDFCMAAPPKDWETKRFPVPLPNGTILTTDYLPFGWRRLYFSIWAKWQVRHAKYLTVREIINLALFQLYTNCRLRDFDSMAEFWRWASTYRKPLIGYLSIIHHQESDQYNSTLIKYVLGKELPKWLRKQERKL